MTNSFNQSPDWASILQDSYQQINASADRNENLERENDRRRIENAGVPLKMLQSIAQFSSTAKQLANAHDQKKIENDNWKRWKIGSDNVHKTRLDIAAEDFTNKKYTIDIKTADKISETNAEAANDFKKESEVIKYKKNLGSLRQDAVRFKNTIFQIADGYQAGGVQYSAVTDFAQSQEILSKVFSDEYNRLRKLGYSDREIRKTYYDVFKSIEATEQKRMAGVNKEAYELQKTALRENDLNLALTSNNTQEELADQRARISHQFSNGLGGALDWQVSSIVEKAKAGHPNFSTDNARLILSEMELKRANGKVEKYSKRYEDKYNAAMLELEKADYDFVKEQKANEQLDFWSKETVAIQKIQETFPENGGIADIEDAINVLDVQGYEPTRLNNMLKNRKEGRKEIEAKEQLFNDKKADGTLTVEEVEATANTYLINKFKADAEKSETARKGESYKLTKKTVGGMVKKVTGETNDTGPLSNESTAVQIHLNQYFEYAYQKQIIADADVDPDTAAINAGLATQKYFTDNGGGTFNDENKNKIFYWNPEANNGIGSFTNFIDEFQTGLPGMDELTSDNPLTLKEMQGVINHNVDNVIRRLQANNGQIGKLLDTEFAFLNQAEVAREIERLNMGEGYSELLKAYTAKFPRYSENEILKRQANALDPTGALAESIPEQPESLKTVYEKGIPELVCIMKKAGVGNMSINQLSRLCTSISDKGTEDKELNLELFGTEEYPLRDYWKNLIKD
jgi:hypothetical protein